MANPGEPGMVAVFETLAEQGRAWLREAATLPPVPRPAMAAALPAVLARRDLRRALTTQIRERGLGDRLAVTTAALTGRGV